MSNIKNTTLLTNGLIEAYALGIATPDEIIEVEAQLKNNAAARAALKTFELELENQYMGTPVTQAFVRPKIAKRSWLNYAAAAAILLLISSTATNVILYNKAHNAENTLAKNNENNNTAFANTIEKYANNDIKQVALKDKQGRQACHCEMYWTANNVQIVICSKHIAKPTDDKQYQLWGLLNGKLENLGVFNLDNKNEINHPLKDPTKPYTGFAVTIENKGGTNAPSMNNLVLQGTV